MRLTTGRLLFVLIAAFASPGAMSQQRAEQPAGDKEIRIGNVMLYSGPLSEFGGDRDRVHPGRGAISTLTPA